MDATEEVDDDGAGSGAAQRFLAEEPHRQQDSQAGSRVRFHHEQDGLSHFLRLRRTQRGQDTVVDGVVQEQHFRGFHDDGGQRQQAVVHQDLDPLTEQVDQETDDGTDPEAGQNGHDHADDAEGEVVNEHLEPARHPAVDRPVELLEDPSGERPHDHGAQEHGGVAADDHAHRRQGPDDRAALSVDHPAARVADEDGKQVGDDRGHHGGQGLVGCPPLRYEEGGEQTPGYECTDVGHDHPRQVASEALDAGTEATAFEVLVDTRIR